MTCIRTYTHTVDVLYSSRFSTRSSPRYLLYLLNPLLPSTYSLGNETRMDYGTGHELSFAVFMLCLFKLELIPLDQLHKGVLLMFTAYIRTMRRLQTEVRTC